MIIFCPCGDLTEEGLVISNHPGARGGEELRDRLLKTCHGVTLLHCENLQFVDSFETLEKVIPICLVEDVPKDGMGINYEAGINC
jgi:hypothetical protein